MTELLEFLREQALIGPDRLVGLVCAGLVMSGGLLFFTGYVISKFFDFLKNVKLITIHRTQKIDKIVEVPKYIDSKEYKEMLSILKKITSNQNGVKL